MKLSRNIRVSELIKNLQYGDKVQIIGDVNISISGFNDYQAVQSNDITWIESERLYNKVLNSKAVGVIINKEPAHIPVCKTLLITKKPLKLFDILAEKQWQATYKIKENYQIGENSIICDGVRIGKNAEIGNNCTIFPNVVIHDNVRIGNNVIIQSNSVIGSDSFSYIKQEDGTRMKRKVWGNVVIEDNVEIGALCSIDKGITSDTIIGQGTKMDNHVHIGHDVQIGENCLFSGQVGIAGYVQIKDNCSFWGKSAVSNRIVVANNTNVLGSSVVTKNILKENQTLCGFPAVDSREFWKEKAMIKAIIEKHKIK